MNINITDKSGIVLKTAKKYCEEDIIVSVDASLTNGTGECIEYEAGENIKIENNVISVITTDVIEEDNTKPITSGAVQIAVGNIDALLKLI